MTWSKRWLRRFRTIVNRDAVEGELTEELAFHVEMQIQENIRAGMAPGEARRQAMIAFGSMEGHKEAVRDARWFGWVNGLSLDAKLGFRMLFKYPGLTVVGGVAIIVATGLGAALFEFSDIYNPRWPFPEPDRIVAIQNWDMEEGAADRQSLYEVGIWTEESRTLEGIAAYQQRDVTLSTDARISESVRAVQIGSQVFSILRVRPFLGRPLQEEDEHPGAPAVAVIGYDVWQRLFHGDPQAIGATVRLGTEPATLVGVMPEGFGFPLNHEAWFPLPRTLLASPRGEGPPVQIVGRLAVGVSPEEAAAELSALASFDPRAGSPEIERFQPRVMRLTEAAMGSAARWAVYGARLVFLLLMGAICVNVATLVFARAAMRGGEIAIRSAVGASRKRIATQMFIEGLVLTAIPSVIGLAAAAWIFPRVMTLFWQVQEMNPPFWVDGRISAWTALYVGVLAVFGAVIVGVLPALQATGRRLQPRLSQLATGASNLRFGGVWTVVIVIQVAISVALLPFAII